MEAGHVIADLCANLDEGRYEELHQLAKDHWEVINFHKNIEGIQTDCRQILEMVIEGRPFSEIPAFTAYLEIYNKAEAHRLTVDENNRLLTESFINEYRYLAIKEVDGWFGVLEKDMAFCLIEFFRSEKSTDYLKKCRTCNRFYIARQPKIQKFCTKQCRLGRPKPQDKASGEKLSGRTELEPAWRPKPQDSRI